MNKEYDYIIIGAGFYGCNLALFLRQYSDRILILEQASDIMTRASYNNQARVHRGYHYPRNLATAASSAANFKRFCRDYAPAIVDDFIKVYAIAANGSLTSPAQFEDVCRRIGAPLDKAPDKVRDLFAPGMVEEVYIAEEYGIDTGKLRDLIKRRLQEADIEVRVNFRVSEIGQTLSGPGVIGIDSDMGYKCVVAGEVFTCAYAGLPELVKNSHIPLLPIKHEYVEMPLFNPGFPLNNYGITVMDGPFFSVMPYRAKDCYSMHHVELAPNDRQDLISRGGVKIPFRFTKFMEMKADAARYLPLMQQVNYSGESVWEDKIVLLANEEDDGRPIMYRRDYGLKGHHVVLGGKLDNLYDLIEVLEAEKRTHVLNVV